MSYTFAQYQESADYLRGQIGTFTPKVAMILGSGLGYLGDEVEAPIRVPYGQIPHFKTSTAPGHKGQLVFGRLDGQNVGRLAAANLLRLGHLYPEPLQSVRLQIL